jgi:hypothetical protein
MACERCGKAIRTYPSLLRTGRGRFCSVSCASRSKSRGTEAQRFWAKVEVKGPQDCWLWTAGYDHWGYGRFKPTGREAEHAHRTAYRFLSGPIPEGLFVCHRCDNPPCVNPAHLFLGTNAENVADMMTKGRNATAANGRHLSVRHPERLARGDRTYMRQHPEARRGERNPMAKITDAQFVDIQRLLLAGVTQTEAARRYGVDQSAISKRLRNARAAGTAIM